MQRNIADVLYWKIKIPLNSCLRLEMDLFDDSRTRRKEESLHVTGSQVGESADQVPSPRQMTVNES